MLDAETQRVLNAAVSAGDFDKAGQVAEGALATGQRDALLYLFAGVRRSQAGDAHGAVAMLSEADRLQPDNPTTLMALGDALRFTGQLADARRILESAIALTPNHPAAWYGHATTLESMGLLEAALASYGEVVALAPETAPGHAGIAGVLAQLGHADAARAAAEQALALSSADPTARIALARCDLADQRPDDAIAHLIPLVQRNDVPPQDQVVALTLLGDAYDTSGQTDPAFAAYEAANTRFCAMLGAGLRRSQAPFVEQLASAVAATDSASLAAPVPVPAGAAARHIFLLGYPRSGVTLVEQLLATLPDVETIEEHPTLAAASARYLHADGLAALAKIDVAEANDLRAGYWEAVRRFGIDPTAKTFVDMDPLKALQLPLIARLFPDAHVVVVRRDPRDVVWSCFRRSFVPSQASYEFSSLQRAARHYDATMRLTEQCLAQLSINHHVVRYGDLVRDFDGETQRLCAFTGLPWSDAMRRFDRSAMARPVSTRSAEQVRRGLYDGTGQWRRYERQLAPVLPILEPWVRKFGDAGKVASGGWGLRPETPF